jgi:hypothetical protein
MLRIPIHFEYISKHCLINEQYLKDKNCRGKFVRRAFILDIYLHNLTFLEVLFIFNFSPCFPDFYRILYGL